MYYNILCMYQREEVMLPIFQQYIDSKAEASAEGDFCETISCGVGPLSCYQLDPDTGCQKIWHFTSALWTGRMLERFITASCRAWAVLPFLLAL
mgnify:CR=1 FL=1